ncbi:MAG: sel1 repeat family protein, partial [Pyramidobacter sp.]|nr:sel1 repeat family protein [Pyramidobacter sp.]
MKKSTRLTLLSLLALLACAASSLAAPETPASGDVQHDGAPTPFTEGIQAWSAKDYDLARTIFTENAEKGSPQAMTALGYMYAGGAGVRKDLKLAVHWYRMAIAAGEPYAMYALYELMKADSSLEDKPGEALELLKMAVAKDLSAAAHEYYHVLNNEQKTAEAEAFLKKSAEEEQIWAMTALGAKMCDENASPQDVSAGLELLKKSAAKGDVTAYFIAGRVEKRRGNLDEARKLYAEAEKQDYAPALYEQGRLLLDENKGPEAAEHLVKAAEHGYTGAYILLGRMYENGRAVKKDLAAAARYYKQAADAGDAAGCNELGRLAELGLGVAAAPKNAYALYAAGAAAGSAEALYNQGRMELNGIGTAKNIGTGLEKLRAAAEQGESEAKTALAAMYQRGENVDKNPAEAERLYREAAAEGNPRAQFALGEMLKSTTDKERNDEALKYYEQAARAGYAPAQFAMAQSHADDHWHTPDLVRALKWYSAAADQG